VAVVAELKVTEDSEVAQTTGELSWLLGLG
jgi:hypothetical protein